jgi:hypothetical protein
MKKPWLTLISAVFLMLSFSLASCQPGEETPTPSVPTTQIPQTTTSNPITTPAAPTTTTTTEPSTPPVTTTSETPPTTTKTATPTSTTPTTTPPTTTQIPTTTTTEPPITSATLPTTTSTKWQLNGYLLEGYPEFLIDCWAIGDVILEYYLCDSEGPNGSTVGYKMYQSQRAPNELVDHYVQLFESAADYEQYYEDEIGARVLEGTFGEIEARVELGLYWVEEWISISYRTYN